MAVIAHSLPADTRRGRRAAARSSAPRDGGRTARAWSPARRLGIILATGALAWVPVIAAFRYL